MKVVRKMLTLCLLSVIVFGYSQNLEPVKDKVEYKEENAHCWKVIVNPQAKKVKKAFRSFIKDRYKVKMKSKRDVLRAEDVTITKISSKRLNFYASIVEDSGETELKLFGNYGYSVFFDEEKTKEEYNALRSIMVDFINTFLPKYYDEKLKDSSKTYNGYVKEDESLNRKIARNKEEIQNLKSENEDLAEKLKQNKESISQSKEQVVKTQEQLDNIRKQLSSISR